MPEYRNDDAPSAERAPASEIAYEDMMAAIREEDADGACAAYEAMIAALRDEEDADPSGVETPA
jgi:hypothetical protein